MSSAHPNEAPNARSHARYPGLAGSAGSASCENVFTGFWLAVACDEPKACPAITVRPRARSYKSRLLSLQKKTCSVWRIFSCGFPGTATMSADFPPSSVRAATRPVVVTELLFPSKILAAFSTTVFVSVFCVWPCAGSTTAASSVAKTIFLLISLCLAVKAGTQTIAARQKLSSATPPCPSLRPPRVVGILYIG